MFRRILLASAGAIALSGAALAADLTRPPPPPVYIPPAPPALWTGFYLGINAGGTFSSNNTVNTVAFPSSPSAALATFSVSRSNGAFIGGGQLGYNYQFGPSFVAGFEADIQGVAGSNGNTTFTGALGTTSETATVSRQVDYLGTVRGRLGLLATPTFLIYGTGGLAYGGVSASTNIAQNDPITGASFAFGSLNNTRVGWTAGGGVEWMFLPAWSLKVEYLYYDLGSVTFALSPLVNTVSTTFVQSSTRFNGNIVRAGINYHFNWLPAPVVAKY